MSQCIGMVTHVRVATHASDVDGIVSAALILIKYPNAKIDYLTLKDLNSAMGIEYDLIVDLPKLPLAKANVDHHISNYERVTKNNLMTDKDLIDPAAPSAASLLIKYLNLENNPRARKLVDLANIADTGGYSKKTYILDKIIKCHSKEPDILHKIAWILVEKGEEFLDDEWLKNEWKRISDFLEKGREISKKIVKDVLKRKVKNLIVDLIKGFPRLAISDLQWLFINKGGEVIVVINRMRDNDPICPSLSKNANDDTARISIRVSKKSTFNGRELAEKLGGGGHVKAAGARVKASEYYNALGLIIHELSRNGIVGYIRIEIS